MKSTNVLLKTQLQEIYAIEYELVTSLPEIILNIESNKLNGILRRILAESRIQLNRLHLIAQVSDIPLVNRECRVIKKLLKQTHELSTEQIPEQTKFSGLTTYIKRMKWLEISSYQTAIYLAKSLGNSQMINLLNKSLNEKEILSVYLSNNGSENIGRAVA